VRIVVTILIALVLSGLAASMAGVLLAQWAGGDEAFILLFMSVPIVGLVAAFVFLIAATRKVPARALGWTAAILVCVCLVLLGGFLLVQWASAGTLASAWRGMQLMISTAVSWMLVVLVQWAVFLWRSHSATPPAMMFGRGPGEPA